MSDKIETSTFTHDGVEYDLKTVWRETEHIQPILFKLDDLKWLIEEAVWDPDMARRSPNMLRPILVIMWQERICCIDGYHRICNALEMRWPYLLGKWVPNEVMEKARLQ